MDRCGSGVICIIYKPLAYPDLNQKKDWRGGFIQEALQKAKAIVAKQNLFV